MINYKLFIEGVVNIFFPPKELQLQKRYILQGIFKPQDVKIQEFICWVNYIVEYLYDFLLFGHNQGFPEDEIL